MKAFLTNSSLEMICVAFVVADTMPVLVQKSDGVCAPGIVMEDVDWNNVGLLYHLHPEYVAQNKLMKSRIHAMFFLLFMMRILTGSVFDFIVRVVVFRFI